MEDKTPESKSTENQSDQLFNRIRNEPPLTASGVSQPIEPSLEEARADLARAISKIAHSFLSKNMAHSSEQLPKLRRYLYLKI